MLLKHLTLPQDVTFTCGILGQVSYLIVWIPDLCRIYHLEIVNFPFPDGDLPRPPSYGVYISQLLRFARVCSNVGDFNNRNQFLTSKLLKQGYQYHKLRKVFSSFIFQTLRVDC